MESKTFSVPNIGCDGCVRTIKNEVGTVIGVTQVAGDVDSKVVKVDWDSPATWEDIRARLIEIDYAPAEA